VTGARARRGIEIDGIASRISRYARSSRSASSHRPRCPSRPWGEAERCARSSRSANSHRAGCRAVAAVPASAPAYGRRAKPGSPPGVARRFVGPVIRTRSRGIGGSSTSVRLSSLSEETSAVHRRVGPVAGFRAVAADPASAPAYGRRAKPGSPPGVARRFVGPVIRTRSRGIGGSSTSVRRAEFRAVAAVPASAPAYGRRAKPGSCTGLRPARGAACVRHSRGIGGSSTSVRLSCLSEETSAVHRRVGPGDCMRVERIPL
jgi:hypothetical protein